MNYFRNSILVLCLSLLTQSLQPMHTVEKVNSVSDPLYGEFTSDVIPSDAASQMPAAAKISTIQTSPSKPLPQAQALLTGNAILSNTLAGKTGLLNTTPIRSTQLDSLSLSQIELQDMNGSSGLASTTQVPSPAATQRVKASFASKPTTKTRKATPTNNELNLSQLESTPTISKQDQQTSFLSRLYSLNQPQARPSITPGQETSSPTFTAAKTEQAAPIEPTSLPQEVVELQFTPEQTRQINEKFSDLFGNENEQESSDSLFTKETTLKKSDPSEQLAAFAKPSTRNAANKEQIAPLESADLVFGFDGINQALDQTPQMSRLAQCRRFFQGIANAFIQTCKLSTKEQQTVMQDVRQEVETATNSLENAYNTSSVNVSLFTLIINSLIEKLQKIIQTLRMQPETKSSSLDFLDATKKSIPLPASTTGLDFTPMPNKETIAAQSTTQEPVVNTQSDLQEISTSSETLPEQSEQSPPKETYQEPSEERKSEEVNEIVARVLPAQAQPQIIKVSPRDAAFNSFAKTLADFINEDDAKPISVYIDNFMSIRQQLDPVQDADILKAIDVLNTGRENMDLVGWITSPYNYGYWVALIAKEGIPELKAMLVTMNNELNNNPTTRALVSGSWNITPTTLTNRIKQKGNPALAKTYAAQLKKQNISIQ